MGISSSEDVEDMMIPTALVLEAACCQHVYPIRTSFLRSLISTRNVKECTLLRVDLTWTCQPLYFENLITSAVLFFSSISEVKR